jgi:Mycotoxin biosynthesis protein UstYa
MLILVGDQMISDAELQKLDMPISSLKVIHPTTGVEGYRVGLEVFHQLHCINLLRRVTYKDYYEPLGGEFASGPEALQMHTGKLYSLQTSTTTHTEKS